MVFPWFFAHDATTPVSDRAVKPWPAAQLGDAVVTLPRVIHLHEMLAAAGLVWLIELILL